MAGLRVHTVMSQDLVDRIDSAASSLAVSRGEFVRRAVEQALVSALGVHIGPEVERAAEQALGSPGSPDAVAGVRGRVPAPVPAEQPGELAEQEHLQADSDAILRTSMSPRVRSSAAARPFRPAPKKGEK